MIRQLFASVNRWIAWSTLPCAVCFTAQTQPALEISRSAGTVEIRWAYQPPGWVLESAVSLTPPVTWQPAPELPTSDGDRRIVTLTPSGAARFYRLRQAGLTGVAETSPAEGEAGVSVNRETILRFSAPLAANTQIGNDRYYADFGTRRLLSRVELSGDRRSATLFYLEPLPGGAHIRVTFASDGLQDAGGGPVDGDGDGTPGGTRTLSFLTTPVAEVPGTRVIGHVFASEPMPLPGGGTTNRPLAGVTITVDGAEETLRSQTDENGFFSLRSPAGRFFVHVDGRTAAESQWPDGDYYPFVGKTFEAVAGRTNNSAGGTGQIFLPLVKAGTLQPVSATQPTTVTLPLAVLAEHPELAGLSLTVPPNALFADNGTRGGRVGLAPVEPDRIPSPLPPGLQMPLVITIQTDGPSNFGEPVPVRFPNLPDPVTGHRLPPGAKSALWSYNHDTGRWEIQGSMTVTADGNFVETDPGVGIRQPGWHGSSPGSTGGGGGAGGPGPCQAEAEAVQDAFMGCMQGAFLELLELSPGLGCAVSIGQAVVSSIQDCSNPTQNCGGALAYNALFGGLGCIPGVGTVAGYAQCAYELKTATDTMQACQAANTRRAALAGMGSKLHQPVLVSDDDEVLQIQLLGAMRELVGIVAGAPAWLEAAAADNAGFIAFGNALVAALDPASEDAARISVAERAALLALPAPNGLPAATVTALLDRFDRFAQGGMTPAEKAAIENAATALQNAATAAQAAGWETMLDGLLGQLAEITRVNDAGLRGAAGGAGPAAAPPRPAANGPGGYGPVRSHELLYHLVDLRTGFVRRGRTSPNGQLDNLITGVDTPYFLSYLDPETLEIGTTHFRSGPAGDRFTLPLGLLARVNAADTDGDGLNDVVEEIVGTRPDAADTDNDGASDFAEVREGQNPLDGLALPQAVVANLPLGGSTTGIARDAVALGLHVDGDLVFVANGRRGLAVVDARDPWRPVWLGDLDLSGESFDVTYAPNQQVVGVVALPEEVIPGERGLLHFVDASNPAAPQLLQTYSLPAVAIDHWNGQFFVALGQFALKEVRIYDAASALEVGRFATQDFSTGLRVVGGRAYVATLSGLEIFDVTVPQPVRLGRLAGDFTPELLGRAHLVLDGTTLFVSKKRGVATIDVSDPAAPRFLGVPPATTGAVRSLALTGGPRMLALTLGTPDGNPSASASLSIYDASDPANTTTFLFGITTVGIVRDVGVIHGLAVVADDRRGLTFANFADPDLARQAPAITFDPVSLDLDATQAGVQVRAGAALELTPVVHDDVHLTRVELLVDGVPVQSQAIYPVNFRLNLPTTAGSSVTVRFRATDGAGNVGTSAPATLNLVADTEPPAQVFSLPAAGGAAFLGHPFVLRFNEPVDTLPVDLAKVRLTHFGADAAPGGGDDSEFGLAEVTANGAVVVFGIETNLVAGRCQLTLDAGAVKDRSGNATSRATSVTFDLLDTPPGSAVWISDADGNWDAPTNWLHGRLPAQDDHVVLQRFGAKPKVTLNTSATVKSLRAALPLTTTSRAGLTVLRDLSASEPVEIPARNIIVNGSATFEQALTINGGTLEVSGRLETRAVLTLGNNGALTLSSPGAQFVPTGGVQGANFRFTARDGAVITLSGFANYDGASGATTFLALGTDSRLTLPDMVTATGPVNWNIFGAPALSFEATSGGRLELPALTTLSHRVKLEAGGDGSLLRAPGLTSVNGTEAPFPAGITASNNGRVQVPLLTTIVNCPITEQNGGAVERP